MAKDKGDNKDKSGNDVKIENGNTRIEGGLTYDRSSNIQPIRNDLPTPPRNEGGKGGGDDK